MRKAIVDELVKIADDLDRDLAKIDAAYERRAVLWQIARDEGATTPEMAVPSRVKDVTIRQTLARRANAAAASS